MSQNERVDPAFLGEVALKMMEYFPDAPVQVERFIDPEATDSRVTLFVVAKVHCDVDELLATLERIDNEWWLANQSRGHWLVQISVDPV